jgi:uncharacterized protein DUF1735
MNKRILKAVATLIPALWLVLLSGCLKTHDGFIDFTQTTDFVILTGAGLGNFKASNINVNKDTVSKTITVDLASKDNSNGAVTVTLGVDNTVIDAYNTANGTHYLPLPANAYKIFDTKVTIPAGQHYGSTTLEIYQANVDPTLSYMLPVTIVDGGGKSLSSNQNIIYYNIIGNPIAGAYTHEWIRWNNATGTGTPAFDQTYPDGFTAVNPTTISVYSGTGTLYLVSFTNTNGVLSNFTVAFPTDPANDGSPAFNGITITSGPTITLADPINHKYEFTFNYNNSSGSPRVIIDKFAP